MSYREDLEEDAAIIGHFCDLLSPELRQQIIDEVEDLTPGDGGAVRSDFLFVLRATLKKAHSGLQEV